VNPLTDVSLIPLRPCPKSPPRDVSVPSLFSAMGFPFSSKLVSGVPLFSEGSDNIEVYTLRFCVGIRFFTLLFFPENSGTTLLPHPAIKRPEFPASP